MKGTGVGMDRNADRKSPREAGLPPLIPMASGPQHGGLGRSQPIFVEGGMSMAEPPCPGRMVLCATITWVFVHNGHIFVQYLGITLNTMTTTGVPICEMCAAQQRHPSVGTCQHHLERQAQPWPEALWAGGCAGPGAGCLGWILTVLLHLLASVWLFHLFTPPAGGRTRATCTGLL